MRQELTSFVAQAGGLLLAAAALSVMGQTSLLPPVPQISWHFAVRTVEGNQRSPWSEDVVCFKNAPFLWWCPIGYVSATYEVGRGITNGIYTAVESVPSQAYWQWTNKPTPPVIVWLACGGQGIYLTNPPYNLLFRAKGTTTNIVTLQYATSAAGTWTDGYTIFMNTTGLNLTITKQ